MPEGRQALRSALAALRQAFANDGIRRLGISWMLGVAADTGLFVVTLVTVFNLGGAVAAAVLGAVRMVPAVIAGLLTGAMLQRFRGDRILVALGLIRAVSAGLTGVVIATAGTSLADHQVTMVLLFIVTSMAAGAGAPVRPVQATLMPALARSPDELVAANAIWNAVKGLGAFGGPFIAAVLMAVGMYSAVAAVAAVAFLLTVSLSAGLRFEQAADASGGGSRASGGLRLKDGLRPILRQPVLAWSLLGSYGQVVTRGLLNSLVVVAAIDLLGMGQSGLGLLNAALGLGGLGAIFVLSSNRSPRLIRTETLSLLFWGLPIAVIGVFPLPEVALAAMVLIGLANATYDTALYTIFQRGSTNDDRATVMSFLEAVIGVGTVSGSLLAPVLLLFGDRAALVIGGSLLPILAAIIYRRIGHTDKLIVVDEDLVDLLRKVPEFAELPMTGVERLATGLVPVTAPAGSALMTQGEPGDRFVVIATGEIDVILDGRPIRRLGPGAGVGEIALLRRSPRTATVRAVTDVTGYAIDAMTFLAAVAGPAAAAVTERLVAERIGEANVMRSGASD
jgi:MFS family permease